MISGSLGTNKVAQSDVRNLMNIQDQGLDRRSTRMYDNKNSQYANPFDMIQINCKLPQFSGLFDARSEETVAQITKTDFSQQLNALSNPPNIDIVQQIKDQAQTIRLTYGN